MASETQQQQQLRRRAAAGNKSTKGQAIRTSSLKQIIRSKKSQNSGDAQVQPFILEDLIFVTIGVLLLYDFFSPEGTALSNLCDCLTAVLSIRDRKVPAGSNLKPQDKDDYYWLLNPRKDAFSRLDALSRYLIIKFALGIILSFSFFGTFKLPSITDVSIYGFAIALINFSPFIYGRMKHHFDTRFTVTLGVGIFKARRFAKAIAIGSQSLTAPGAVAFSVLSMEGGGFVRDFDLQFTHLSPVEASRSFAANTFMKLTSSDFWLNVFAACLFSLSKTRSQQIYSVLAWLVVFFRYLRSFAPQINESRLYSLYSESMLASYFKGFSFHSGPIWSQSKEDASLGKLKERAKVAPRINEKSKMN